MLGKVKSVIPMYMGRLRFKGNKKYLSIYSMLIEAEGGYLLYDAGLHTLFYTDPDKIMGDLSCFIQVETEKELCIESQLKKHGLNTSDIYAVICSHLHFDHCGGIHAFKADHTKILVQKKEYEAALQTKRNFEYNSQLYVPMESRISFLEGEEDYFRNESIKIIYTPGHSRGHQSLLLKGDRYKLLLAGDAAYTTEQFRTKRTGVFSYDKSLETKSLDLLHTYLDEDTTLLCGHDQEVIRNDRMIRL